MSNPFESIVKEKPSDELLVMVYQFDLWNSDMLEAVKGELKSRNILPNDIDIRKQQIINNEEEELSRGKAASIGGQIFGWIFVFGILGLIIGYNYAYSKVRSKYTKKKYYRYDKDTRDNGTYMFYTSLAVFILYFIYKIATLE